MTGKRDVTRKLFYRAYEDLCDVPVCLFVYIICVCVTYVYRMSFYVTDVSLTKIKGKKFYLCDRRIAFSASLQLSAVSREERPIIVTIIVIIITERV